MTMKRSMKPIATAAVVACAVVFVGATTNTAQATCVPEPYLGSVCATAASFCPKGYIAAEGQMLKTEQNMALFALIGTVYGGDGRTNFAVPDLRGRSIVSQGQAPGLVPVLSGQMRGSDHFTKSNVASGKAGENTVNIVHGKVLPPQLAMRYCLAVEGLFPSRN